MWVIIVWKEFRYWGFISSLTNGVFVSRYSLTIYLVFNCYYSTTKCGFEKERRWSKCHAAVPHYSDSDLILIFILQSRGPWTLNSVPRSHRTGLVLVLDKLYNIIGYKHAKYSKSGMALVMIVVSVDDTWPDHIIKMPSLFSQPSFILYYIIQYYIKLCCTLQYNTIQYDTLTL